MDQWTHIRNRYLYLLLEMEGVTKSPNCSLCGSTMAIKCGDCIGGNYFCVSCCLHSHMRSPFHRIFHWNGVHFSPISLYALGFKLCLEHDGEPCPLTVDVRRITIVQLHFTHLDAGNSCRPDISENMQDGTAIWPIIVLT